MVFQDGICQGYFLPQNTKIKKNNALVLLIHLWGRSTRALKYTASLKVNTSGFVTQ